MSTLSPGQPWRRQADPQPIPEVLDVDSLLGMDDQVFAQLVRDNLLPRQDRGRWQRLWTLLATDDDLADQTFDALESLIGDCEQDLDSGLLDERETGRARKYLEQANIAWRRLEDDTGNQRLQWAGRAGSKFSPGAQKVIAALVQAIDEHRDAKLAGGDTDPVDQRLWAVLRTVDLDPQLWAGKRVDVP